jgi:hypothetical protein
MSVRSKLHQLKLIARSPERYIPFYIQRRVENPKWRARMARHMASRKPAAVDTAYLDSDVFARLDKSGISHLAALLSAQQVAEARAWLEQCTVADPYHVGEAGYLPLGEGRNPTSHVAYHRPADVIAAPHLMELANAPAILAVAERFLGCRPTIGYLAAWWSYPTGLGAQQAEHFHRDVDDWKFLKLFVYLSDVGPDEGPHVYVQGSSASGKLTKIRRYQDDEIVAAFGDDAVLVNTGKAGDGFFEDTYGFHKGMPVNKGARLIFQAVYSQTPLPYAPRFPVADSGALRAQGRGHFDAYINRLYLKDR